MIYLRKGDILSAKTDHVVNPANSFLRHSGGLARMIAAAAAKPFAIGDLEQYRTGPDGSPVASIMAARDAHLSRRAHWFQDHNNAPLIATGNAYETSSGALPFRSVIHAVGPVWNGGDYCELGLLEMAYESALMCVSPGHSVAVPAISAGVFGAPIEHSARIGVEVARWFSAIHIEFWLFSDEHLQAFQEVLHADD